jgi:TPR repeat protein
MDDSECWNTASRLHDHGETTKAMDVCLTAPCSAEVNCQRYLGWAYFRLGDTQKSLEWLSKAAEQGDGKALFNIGGIYYGQKRFDLAYQYFQSAVKNGNARGHHWIAGMELHGLGVELNLDKALSNYKHGAEHGYFAAERGYLHLLRQTGSFLTAVWAIGKLILFSVHVFVILFRNKEDLRVVDLSMEVTNKMRI